MPSSQEYKRQIMRDLSQGNVESLNEESTDLTQQYQNFDDFTQRSSKDERRQLFSRSMHPERIPPSQMEPELQKAIAQIQPKERDDVARDMFKQLKKRGLSERDLEKQLGLSTHNPNRMNADDVSKLANFVYHSHPDIFHDVLADKPWMLKFLSNPIVAAALGIAAAKWFSSRS
ncbi:MAG: hypothetical protein ACOC04_04260 [Halothece sp.]